MRKFFPIVHIVILIFPIAAACGNGASFNDSASSYECNRGSQSNEFVHSPGGLLFSAQFKSTDVNYSSPIMINVIALNPAQSHVQETVTLNLNGMHLPNPLIATHMAHEPVAEYRIDLELLPGETTCYEVVAGFPVYEAIGTGNYNLYYAEGAEHLDHMNLSGALEIIINAPETITKDQDLQYQVEVHNPTNVTVHDISVHELHNHFEEFIPVLFPGDTVLFTHTLSSSKYQNSHVTGVTILTETLENGSDFASKTVEVEGFFED